MTIGEVRDLLDQGIAKAKEGDLQSARELLLRVVELDEQNEQAWIWLSSVVETNDDRIICLQNTLVLNPYNKVALKGLEELGVSPANETSSNVSVKEFEPVSPAASILYPERYRVELPPIEEPALRMVDIGAYRIRSEFDDIWERDCDICAYCAHEVELDTIRCPGCRRKISKRTFRYPLSSQEMTIFWTLLLGVAQLLLLQAILEVLVREPLTLVIMHGLLFVMTILLAIGVAMRQIWAYPASIVYLMILLTGMAFAFVSGAHPEQVLSDVVGDDLVDLLSTEYDSLFLLSLITVVQIMRFAAALLALLYGIFKIGPDFERVRIRYFARLDRDVSDASGYYARGKLYADQKMWASAVLHWRKAAALEPARAFYLQALGGAYAELGYYERSLDVLKSALDRTLEQSRRQELESAIAEVETRTGGHN